MSIIIMMVVVIIAVLVKAMTVVVIIIIIILVSTFMQGIYNYIPETNHVSRVYRVADVLYRQFLLHVVLFCPRYMFCSFTLAYYHHHHILAY